MRPHTPHRPLRVLVVDDSPFMRAYLRRVLQQQAPLQGPGGVEITEAADGEAALRAVARQRPDVVTLDVEMPGMDGLTCLRTLMARHPLPVVMLSGLTTRSAPVTMEALAAGAVDFVAKPDRPVSGMRPFAQELAAKLWAAARVPRAVLERMATQESPPGDTAPRSGSAGAEGVLAAYPPARRIVVIGASTGGPHTLEALLRRLPGSLAAGVLITQHMPPGFTASLARRLNDRSPLVVLEAPDGAAVREGVAYMAPGGFHLSIARDGYLRRDEGPPVHHVRPAVDVMFQAAARAYGPRVLAVVLTGMGEDGTAGARAVKAAGGRCLAQDPLSCVAPSMPESVVAAGLADAVEPPEQLAERITRWAGSEGAWTPGKEGSR